MDFKDFMRGARPVQSTSLSDMTLTSENFFFSILQVSGLKFETKLETLAKYPDTLLGNEEKRKKYKKHIMKFLE